MPHINELYDFTVSAYIISPDKTKVLLLFHTKRNVWQQPGGHIELNEDIDTALYREILEETGLSEDQLTIVDLGLKKPPLVRSYSQLTPFSIVVHPYDDSTHQHIDLAYIFMSKTEELTKNPDGATAINWFTSNDIELLHKNKRLEKDTKSICQNVLDQQANSV